MSAMDSDLEELDLDDLEDLEKIAFKQQQTSEAASGPSEGGSGDEADFSDKDSGEESKAADGAVLVKKRRAKRGGFKKGSIYRRKRQSKELGSHINPGTEASSSNSEIGIDFVSTDVDADQLYGNDIASVLITNEDAIEDDSRSILDESLPGLTTDNEGFEEGEEREGGEDEDVELRHADGSKESEILSTTSDVSSGMGSAECQNKQTQRGMQRRRKKGFGMKRKYTWKSTSTSGPTTEDEDSLSVADLNVTGPASTSTGSEHVECAAKSEENIETLPSKISEFSKDDVNQRTSLTQSVTHENLMVIANNLKGTLDDSFNVSVSNDILYIYKVVNPINPLVERAITWHLSKVKFMVLNKVLSESHILYKFQKKPDLENWGAITDYLTSLSARFLQFRVCDGVSSHSEAWDIYCARGNGFISSQCGRSIMRSSSCSLVLLSSNTCVSCLSLKTKMAHYMKRQNKRGGSLSVTALMKVNNKYLSKEELIRKNELHLKEKKLSKQEVHRMKLRIDKLLETRSQKIDAGLSEDLEAILDENVDEKNENSMQSIFWKQQKEALKKKRAGASKTMRWHPGMIRLALSLRMLSPAAYDFMKGFICLPSQRRLYDYSQFTEIQEGVQQDLMELLFDMIQRKCPQEPQQYFSLLLDEMSIRSDLVYSSRTGGVIGYTKLTPLEESLRQLEAEIQDKNYERRLAKKVLVFMLHGILVQEIRFVPAIFSTDDLSAAQLLTRMWEVVYAVEEAGAKVLIVIFDGASVNRKLIKMHIGIGEEEFVYSTLNVAAGEFRILYFMLDPPHLIKTFRNCFANSGSHRNSRSLWKDGEPISWKAIEALYDLIKSDKFKSTKLTKAHVKLTSFSCMKVSLAAQVFSASVANALEKNKDQSPLKEFYSGELVQFIQHMNRFFDCVNGGEQSKKKNENPDLEVYQTKFDPRFEFLEIEFLGFLSEWERSIKARPGKFSQEERSRMIISYQSLEAIKITVCSFKKVVHFLLDQGAKAISARQFNQDPLEQYFSILRLMRGADDNPNLKQVLHTRLSLQAQDQGVSYLGARGNTEVFKRNIDSLADASPLPVRKKLKP